LGPRVCLEFGGAALGRLVRSGRPVKATRRVRVDTSGGPKWTQFPSRRKHDLSGSYPYEAWLQLKRDCRRRGDALYGPWRAFEVFYRDVGRRPDGTVLRRYDASGKWEPGNVCWARWDPKTRTAVLPERKNENESKDDKGEQ